MTSAKVTIKTQDRSAIVPAIDGVYAGVAVASTRGPMGVPRLITSTTELLKVYGIPDPSLGVAMYSALTYLKEGNKLWVTRVLHEDATFAAATVRWKIEPVASGFPDYDYRPDYVVNPIVGGLKKGQIPTFPFPLSNRNRLFEDIEVAVQSVDVPAGMIKVNDPQGRLGIGDLIAVTNTPFASLSNSETIYSILDILNVTVEATSVTLDTPVTVTQGDIIELQINGGTSAEDYVPYTGNPTVIEGVTNSKTIILDTADYIQIGDIIRIGGSGGPIVEVQSKSIYNTESFFIQFDDASPISVGYDVYKVVADKYEERDAFLVYSVDPSTDWNKLSIGIAPSKNYPEAFNLLVYYEGILEETWEVTRKDFIDGFGRQMYIEDRVNGKSSYIMVRDNPSAVDPITQEPYLPLNTDHSIWRAKPLDVFVDTGLEIIEPLIKGDVQVQFPADPSYVVALTNRVKFVIGDDDDGNVILSKEYKVQSIDSINGFIVLDRKIQEDQINEQWTDHLGNVQDTTMYFFDETNNDPASGIFDGIKRSPIETLPNVYYNYPLNSDFTVAGVEGILLDPGVNFLLGGSLGTRYTVSDIRNALFLLKNKEKTPVTLVMDGGFAIPAVAQAVQEVCEAQGLTHGYVSDDSDAERSSNYKQAIVDYRNSTNLNTDLVSFFAGWVLIQDDYNQKQIYVAPDGFAAASQSFTTRNFSMFTPAAGWTRGKINALGVLRDFDEGDRDYLIDNRINPIRSKEGSGLVIWGNETTLVKPSPLQLRSVAMLLIVIKNGLEKMLEYKTFEFNNERTWTQVEGALNGFMRDEIQAKQGVVDFQVAIKEVITPSDLDNRRMPIFLGIKPTMDIQTIPVTLAIFNNSIDIQVAL